MVSQNRKKRVENIKRRKNVPLSSDDGEVAALAALRHLGEPLQRGERGPVAAAVLHPLIVLEEAT